MYVNIDGKMNIKENMYFEIQLLKDIYLKIILFTN